MSEDKADGTTEEARRRRLHAELQTQLCDQVLKSVLVRSRKSNADGAELLVRILREAQAFADRNSDDATDSQPKAPDPTQRSHQQSGSPATEDVSDASPAAEPSETLMFRAGPNCQAQVRFYGIVSKGDVARLIKLLELSLDNYP